MREPQNNNGTQLLKAQRGKSIMTRLLTRRLKFLGLALATPIWLAGCRGGESTGGYDSPEAVHQAMCNAVQAKEWKELAGCLTPESRDQMAGTFVMMGAFMAMDEEHGPAVQELFRRHGIEEPNDEPTFGQVPEPLSTDVKLSYRTPIFMTDDPQDSPESQGEPPLVATLVLKGKPIAEALRIGFLLVDAARDDQGNQLKLFNAKRDHLDVDGDFADAGDPCMRDPRRPVQIDLMLEHPAAQAKSLALLEGSLKLVTGGRPETVLIENIKDITPETVIENKVLQAAGVTLRMPFPVSENMVCMETQGPIWSVDVVDGEGKKVNALWTSSLGESQHQTLQAHSQTPLPTDVGLKLTVVTGQEPETVPFKFEDVPLPAEGEESRGEEAAFLANGPSAKDLLEMARPVRDKVAFIAEMLALLEETSADDIGPPGLASGKLEGLKIAGDTATAIQVSRQDGEEQRESIEFRRINGRWFVHLPPEGGFSG